MAQATWHSSHGSFRQRSFHLPEFRIRPPSEETGLVLAICAIVGAVVFLQLQGAVRPRPIENPGIRMEARGALPVVPPPPLLDAQPVTPPSVQAVPLAERPAVQAAVPPPVIAQATSIRSIDLEALPAMRNLTAQTGLSVDRERVTYGVVAGAGDVAIVPLLSGGSGGTMAVAVLGIGRDGPQVYTLLTPDSSARGRIRVAVEGGQLVSSIAVLGPEDALCCPSQTKRTYYAWDGGRLRVEREVTSQNAPSAKD